MAADVLATKGGGHQQPRYWWPSYLRIFCFQHYRGCAVPIWSQPGQLIWWTNRNQSCVRYGSPQRDMITSSNGNIFRVTGPLCGEFTGHRWIPHTKASDAELWCFFYLRLNKRLSKPSWGWWFETPSYPLWRHCNETYWCDLQWIQLNQGEDTKRTEKFYCITATIWMMSSCWQRWHRIIGCTTKSTCDVPELHCNYSISCLGVLKLCSLKSQLLWTIFNLHSINFKNPLNPIRFWQVPLQLSITCQIWTWYSIGNQFHNSAKLGK